MLKRKTIKDCVYGQVNIPHLCQAFIDVPEFQRLRRVKQLGMSHYTYPSATHTRFEHSIGVMHLAGKMVTQLQEYIKISDRVKDLVQLAALYHDIGHFSYSHLFDRFLKSISDADIKKLPTIFQHRDHEDRSLFFLAQVNARLQLLTADELKIVSAFIQGEHLPDVDIPSCLFEIVCNRKCGIDVDRLDYLNRDAYHAGFPAFQADYIILNTVVVDGHLAFASKCRIDINDVFITRERMFNTIYLHHTTLKMDKIHFCAMKRLGTRLFAYGEKTDDANIDTLIRNSPDLADLVECIDTRQLSHECGVCAEYVPKKTVKSNSIESVPFV